MVDRTFEGIHSRHTNCSYVEIQLDQLCSKVGKLKYIAEQIREETIHQNVELSKYQKLMDLTNNLVGQSRRRVMQFSQSGGSWKIYFYLMFFSLFVFLIIIFLIK